MAALRACQPCRSAKVKCDLTRPVCGRCARRATPCFGFSDDIFRDETAIIEARAIRQIPRQGLGTSRPDLSGGVDTPMTGSSTFDDDDQADVAPWLNADAKKRIPDTVTGDLDTRAVDHFFTNWVMWPCSHGITPGHLADMPAMYEQSMPGTSIRLAIEALAYADIPHHHGKARTKYGHALSRVRAIIDDPEKIKNDALLTSLIVIDNFELMHLGRNQPLGPHTVGLFHLLRARGNSQLFNHRGFGIWRVAHHRLQMRQLLLKERPHPDQEEWVSELNTKQPDLHVIEHVFEISKLVAQAHTLLNEVELSHEAIETEVQGFYTKSVKLLTDCTEWTSHMPDTWKGQVTSFCAPPSVPVFLPTISLHHDILLANILNFHNSAMVMMREAVIDILQSPLRQHLTLDDVAVTEAVTSSKRLIHDLSVLLLQTLPQILGVVDFRGQPRRSSRDLLGHRFGNGLCGYFAMFALWTIRASKHASKDHKDMSESLLDWLHHNNESLL